MSGDLSGFSYVDAFGQDLELSYPVSIPAPVQRTDVALNSFALSADGGVDFSYAIIGRPLPSATTIALYWSAGDLFYSTGTVIPGSVTTTGTVAINDQPIHIDASTLGSRPKGTKYLWAVADPDHQVDDRTTANNSLYVLVIPDLSANSVSRDQKTGDVTFNYVVSGLPPSDATIDLYWSDGGTLEGQKARANVGTYHTGTVHGDYSVVIPKDDLTSRPDWATYLVAVLDYVEGNPVGNIVEVREWDNNISTPLLMPRVTVSAVHDADPSATVFGPYLTLVPLANTFTASITDPGKVVDEVEYSLNMGSPVKATRITGTDQWTFDPRADRLAAGNTELKVTALDANHNTLAEFTGMVAVKGSLDYTLAASYPAGPSTVDAADLRFIRGISLTPTFTGSIADLPDFYAGLVQVHLGNNLAIQNLDIHPNGTIGVKFTFNYDTQNLPAGQTIVSFDFKIGNSVAAAPGTPFQTLFAVDLPKWMGMPTTKGYDLAVGSYVVDLAFPPQLQFDLGKTSGTPFGLFNGLKSQVGAGLHLTLFARPTTGPNDATLVLKDMFATATLLGKIVLDEEDKFPSDKIKPEAHIDPKTLDATTEISFSTATPVSLLDPDTVLFDVPFGTKGKPFMIPLPLSLLSLLLSTELSLDGDFQGLVSQLTVSAGIKLDVRGPVPVLVADGTFVQIDAAASVTLDLKVTGALGFKILPPVLPKIISAVVEGKVSATVAARLRVNFWGPIDSLPESELDEDKSYAGLAVAYSLKADYAILKDAPDLGEDVEPLAEGHPTLPLFGLDEPPLTAYHLTGPGSGNTMGPADSPAPAPTQHAAFAVAAIRARDVQAVTSTLASEAPVYGPIDDVRFTLNVLGDCAKLTPGHHFLDAVLVADDGNEVSVSHLDLATYALLPGANPLGFAGGSSPVRVPVGTSALDGGRPYHVEFRLTNDRAGTGEAVAVTIESLAVGRPLPLLAVTSPDGGLAGGTLTLDPAALAKGVATVHLANAGAAPLHFDPLSLAGSGFVLVSSPASGFALLAGESTDILVKPLDETLPSDATLLVASDDPSRPYYQLALRSVGTSVPASNHPPLLTAIGNPTANPGGVVLIQALATDPDPGQVLTYTLDPGAPSGAVIDPKTGAFSWPVPASESPGNHLVTVRVTDDGTPPLDNPRTFLIVVVQAASLSDVSGTGTYGTTATLTATLSAGASPLAGKAVTFNLYYGGDHTTLGTVTTGPDGVASLNGVSLAAFRAGTYPDAVTVVFPGDSTLAGSSARGRLTVARATPTINWGKPADIVYGTPLSAIQLDASSSVAGTFAYSPATDAYLNAGQGQTLQATFTPDDAADYNGLTLTSLINVAQAPLNVSADDAGIVAGQGFPAFTAHYTGFARGEGPGGLGGVLSFSVPAGAADQAGWYPITLGGLNSSNYAITYGSGTLVVSPQAAALVTVRSVVWQNRKLRHHKTAKVLVVSFSEAIDQGHAQDLAAYHLVGAGKDKKFGTKDDIAVSLASATYDPGVHAVTLTLRGKKLPNQALQFTVTAGRMFDARGRQLDGNRDGRAGGDFSQVASSRGISAAALSGSELSSRVSVEAFDALAVTDNLTTTKNRRRAR